MPAFLHFLQRSHRSLKFALVGGTGFLLDFVTFLVFLEYFQIDLMPARCLAFIIAASSNWFLNRIFTFSDISSGSKKSTEWFKFFISAVFSAIPNLGTFYLLMLLLPQTMVSIVVAMCCGILTGYYTNYRLAASWVFKSEISN